MKKILFLASLLLSTVYGQTINYDIHNTPITEYFELEKKNNSEELLQTTKNYLPNNERQPVQFQTKEKTIPDLITTYFYRKSDSVILEIEHEWDVYNFEKQDNNKKSPEFQNAMIEKYKELKRDVTKLFGEPVVRRNYSNISRLDSINTFVENSKWIPDDKTEIELYATVSNYYEKREFTVINPVHRIRLYIRNTEKEEDSKGQLTEDKVFILNVTFKAFFQLLRDNKKTESKGLLSDLIRNEITDDLMQELIDELDFSRDIEMFSSGIDIQPDGKIFTVLQSKYSNDNSETPNEIMQVFFDDKNKILAIQPMTKSNN